MPRVNSTTMIRVGDRLPDLTLPGADGAERPLRGPHRDAVIVVALHDTGCDRCRRYLRELADARPRFRIWDGTVRAVTDDPDIGNLQRDLEGDLQVGDRTDVLVDAERRLLDRVEARDGPVVLVADRYGQLYEILPAGRDHTLPTPGELEAWLQYLATQCPECGVLDQPGRDGRSL